MDFFTDLMGLILLIVCILIVLIFLKDYIRLGGKKTTVNKKQKMIVYEVHQNNKRIQQGWITDDLLPFQFGRNAGSGNDVVVLHPGDTLYERYKRQQSMVLYSERCSGQLHGV